MASVSLFFGLVAMITISLGQGRLDTASIIISNAKRQLQAVQEIVEAVRTSIDLIKAPIMLQTNRTTRNQTVAFQAILQKSISSNVDKKTAVVFDTVELNSGGGYDTKTGKFTAPVEGIYAFHWTCMTHTDKMFRTFLVVNGKDKVGNHVAARIKTDDHDTGSQTYVGRLKKGDVVWIRRYTTESFLRGERWSAFAGYMI